MANKESTPVYSSGEDRPTYLDIQAAVGISKHMGGHTATDKLHQLCHLEDAEEVLEVGCGIGVGPAYIAKTFDCRVVAIDLSEKMLTWARQRAEKEGVADRITFRQADMLELPFEGDRFDAVIVESVLAFVEEKKKAFDELIRVTKPGGYVGLNECFWTETPPDRTEWASSTLGTAITTEEAMRALWEATPLVEKAIHNLQLDAKQEVRDRTRWIGWRYILPAWGRVIRLLLTNPGSRESLKAQFDEPMELFEIFAYALYVGRKPMHA